MLKAKKKLDVYCTLSEDVFFIARGFLPSSSAQALNAAKTQT